MSLNGNIMTFEDFRDRMSPYLVFSLRDVRKACPDFSYRQLDRWEKKGRLRKIRRGFYCFQHHDLSEHFLFYVANTMYVPSYVSLEMALRIYNFIPEEIFQITSVSTKKTTHFETDIGNFSYAHVKPDLYWGYHLVGFGRQNILLAEPEKAILDYLYLHPNLKTADDFLGMRLNVNALRSLIDFEKFEKYIEAFHHKQLRKRARLFLTTLQHDNP